MDIRTIKKLIELVKETGVAKLEITDDKNSVRITSAKQATTSCESTTTPTAIPATAPLPTAATETATTQKEPPVPETGHKINCPMVGTAYLAASPGAKNFVEIGQQVKAGDVLCLIEAMKMFNRIESDKTGTVKKCLIKNGQPVEYDQTLFIIEE